MKVKVLNYGMEQEDFQEAVSIYFIICENGKSGEEIAYVGGSYCNLKKFYGLIEQDEAYEKHHGIFEAVYTKEDWEMLSLKFNFLKNIVEYNHDTKCLFKTIGKYFEENNNDIYVYAV